MKKIQIINGANLNLLGKREVKIYGESNFEDFLQDMRQKFKKEATIEYFQSNIEGEIINKIQACADGFDAIILNAGAYSHTSIAIRDAIASIQTAVIEVHISNIYAREEFRHKTIISPVCNGIIIGFGLNSYTLAIKSIIE